MASTTRDVNMFFRALFGGRLLRQQHAAETLVEGALCGHGAG